VLVHPPGGLVGGDRLDIELDVQPGAHLLVTTPAATRFYRSAAGEAAQLVRARVGAGARLEWLPQETLAYPGCQARNEVRLGLAPGASLFATEVLGLGLPAAGQPFDAGRLLQHLEVAGQWLDRGRLDAADKALLDGPCGLAGHRVLGTLVYAQTEALPTASSSSSLARLDRSERGQPLGARAGRAAAGAAARRDGRRWPAGAEGKPARSSAEGRGGGAGAGRR